LPHRDALFAFKSPPLLAAAMPLFGSLIGGFGHTSPMEPRTDPDGHSIHLDRATVEDAQHAKGWSVRWKRNGDGRVAPKRGTRYLL
jgi:hypothetical protein